MPEDFVMWDIDSLLESYSEIPEWKASLEEGLEELFRFLERNGLLLCKVTDGNGAVLKREIKYSELTDEGRAIACGPKNLVHRWLVSKGVQKTPPDLKILEKALVEIRK